VKGAWCPNLAQPYPFGYIHPMKPSSSIPMRSNPSGCFRTRRERRLAFSWTGSSAANSLTTSSRFATLGPGVEELRIRDENGAFRVIYTARFPEAVYARYAFQKKTRKTAQTDIDFAKARYQVLLKDREK
jgi:phage-related protein